MSALRILSLALGAIAFVNVHAATLVYAQSSQSTIDTTLPVPDPGLPPPSDGVALVRNDDMGKREADGMRSLDEKPEVKFIDSPADFFKLWMIWQPRAECFTFFISRPRD